ncbi:hypothetical protein ABPG72_010560 [Tetrahymena utriculariae]
MIIKKIQTQFNKELPLSDTSVFQNQNCDEIQVQNVQLMYQNYQNITKLYQQIYQNQIHISEEQINLIIEQESEVSQIAIKLQKQQEFNHQWQLLIRFFASQYSQHIKEPELKDKINYLQAKTYVQENNFQKASEIYQQLIQINNKIVPTQWIPFIVVTFQKQNKFKQLSNFCLEQQKCLNKLSSEIDYYLLLNILNKKADVEPISQFMKTYQIEQLIDSIISSYSDNQFLSDLYNRHLIKYQSKDYPINLPNNSYNLPKEFFYQLIQSYGQVLKQVSYPSIQYIHFNKKLKLISNTQQQDSINLEIAKTYQDLDDLQHSIKYYERYLMSVPKNLSIMFDLQFLYQSSEDQQRMYNFFKKILIDNPQQIQYYGIIIQNCNITFSQLKSLILEYLSKNSNHFQNLFKFIEYINNTVFTQNSFFNNRNLVNSFLYFQIENAKALCQKLAFYKAVIPQLTFQPIYSLNDLFFD